MSLLETLHHAVASGDEKAVTTLLAQDPSLLDASDTHTTTALNYALSNNDVAMVSALIAHRPRDEGSNYNALRWAASQGHSNLVTQILANWPDLISRKPSYVLSDAARNNRVEIVTQLLTISPALLLLDPKAIRDAARGGYDEVLNVMLSYNPQSSLSENVLSRTALIAAVTGGHESTVALLLSKAPELIHVVDSSGETPLHCAKKVSIAKQLLDHKPELIDAVGSHSWTALHSAVVHDSIEMIDFLLERRPGLSDVVDANHQNAMHFAACSDHREAFFKLLAQNPRSIDVLTSENKNTLHCAAQAGDPQILDAILSLRPEFACGVDSSGNTALHWLLRGWGRHHLDESYWEKIWQLNPSALRAVNKHFRTPSMIAIDRCGHVRDKQLFTTRKLSWDELITDYEELKRRRQDSGTLDQWLQYSRSFAEEQCESGLSSALLIPGVIGIVKSYIFFPQEVEPSAKRHKGEDDEWHWEENICTPRHNTQQF